MEQVLAKWGNSVVVVPSEFTVREVGDDDLHMLCRAMLLSLPTSQVSVVQSLIVPHRQTEEKKFLLSSRA